VARIRTIKPDFFTSLTIADLPIEARLTFIGLWTHVDDEGRCVDDTRLVRSAIWPLDDRGLADIDKDLDCLGDKGLIRRYSIGGRRYLAVTGWSEHQRISKPTRSKLPAPPAGTQLGNDHSESPPGALPEPSATTPQPLRADSAGERKGKEQGKEGNGEPLAGAGARDTPGSHSHQVAEEQPAAESAREGLIKPLPNEDELPVSQRPPRHWCDEHNQVDDRDCPGCFRDHGDASHYARKRVTGGIA
jgi:hypothetical protein